MKRHFLACQRVSLLFLTNTGKKRQQFLGLKWTQGTNSNLHYKTVWTCVSLIVPFSKMVHFICTCPFYLKTICCEMTVTDLAKSIFFSSKLRQKMSVTCLLYQCNYINSQDIKQKRLQLELAISYLNKPLNLLAEGKKKETEILI